MKQTIQWHEECLSNWRDHFKRKEEEVKRKLVELESDRMRLAAYSHQIAKAKELGKDGFDDEKFLVRKG